MKTEKIKEKYLHYGLEKDDVFKHQHYVIITRSGIEKIQAMENIKIWYECIKCESDFAAVKATGVKEKTNQKNLKRNNIDCEKVR